MDGEGYIDVDPSRLWQNAKSVTTYRVALAQ